MFVRLNKKFSFVSLDGNNVSFAAGADVYLDIDKMIAFKDGYHFSLERDDYRLYC